MSLYTQGPWATACGNCHTIYGPKTNGHEQVIALCPGQTGCIDYDYRNVIANAKLIESAPAMLETLKVVLDRVNEFGNLEPVRDKEIILKIKSIISKIK